MNARYRHLINVLSTGVVVTFLTLVALFWVRWYCHLVRVSALNEGLTRVQISPTGLFPFEKADDPNLASASSATAELHGIAGLFTGLGVVQYVESHLLPSPDSHIYVWEREQKRLRFYFDSSLGLLVYGGESDVLDPNGTVHRRYVTQFAGPEGVAEAPEERLGRFVSPILDAFYPTDPQTVYDKGYRCFFIIRRKDGLVRKGPELPKENGYQPVEMGHMWRNPLSLSVTERDPMYKQPGREELRSRSSREALHTQLPQMDSYPVLVLDASGRIGLLDPDTLTLRPDVGRLPTPPTLFRNPRPVGPEDVAAYCVYPVCDYPRQAEKKWAYAGCLVATASRDLTGMQLAVFDPNGRSVTSQTTYPGPDEMYSSLPGASLVTMIQYVAENLHPLASLMLSSLTAAQVPAESAYQSLILLPNSFAAMAARDMDLGRVNRFAASLPFMLPAIGLGVFLAWRVSRDGARMGLSKQASTLWILGIFALGLPAYVTYRLTRPKVALVTCHNCGLGRRADFEKCQRCGAPWVVPELIPPTWRVIGRPEEQACSDPSPRPEETISNT
jgi:hypothetical protein